MSRSVIFNWQMDGLALAVAIKHILRQERALSLFLGSIEQEINAADDVERGSGPDPQIPTR